LLPGQNDLQTPHGFTDVLPNLRLGFCFLTNPYRSIKIGEHLLDALGHLVWLEQYRPIDIWKAHSRSVRGQLFAQRGSACVADFLKRREYDSMIFDLPLMRGEIAADTLSQRIWKRGLTKHS
jgi:hypothetical protein